MTRITGHGRSIYQTEPLLSVIRGDRLGTYLGKKGSHLGTVEAPDERSAIEQAAKQFNITPARRNKIRVTHTQASEKRDRDRSG